MFRKFQNMVIGRLLLSLAFMMSLLGVPPASAKAEFDAGVLNENGVQTLEENTSSNFRDDEWDAQMDLESGPMFSSANREVFAPLNSTTIGNWSALGSDAAGTDGAISHPSTSPIVNSIAINGTDIYVGGCFLNAGGDPTADYIAKWDTLTGSWSGLGNDGVATPDGALKSCPRAIAVNGTEVYVGGALNTWIGGAPAPQARTLAKWDGTSWSWLSDDGAGGSSFNSMVTAIAVSGNDVYVGGLFTDVKNGSTTLTEADYVAKWDALSGNWSALGNNGMGNGAISDSWGEIWDIVVANSAVYAGGEFTTVYNGLDLVPEAAYLAKWDTLTGNWSALGSNGNVPGGPLNNNVYGLASDGTNLYVAGAFENINNYGTILTAADHVAKWDGANWSALGNDGNGDGSLNDGTNNDSAIWIEIDGTDIYVAGGFTDVKNNGTVLTAADYVAKWDGSNWFALGGNGGGNGSLNTYVYALGLAGNQLYVGGEFANVNNNGTVLNTADYIATYAIGDGIFRVAPDGISTPTCGKDWSTPCDLQYVLTSLAASGDELWGKAGTYKPTTGTDRTISFTLKNGVSMYGGFSGIETSRAQRSFETNLTILSGDIGVVGDDSDNSYRVVAGGDVNDTVIFEQGPHVIDSSTVLDGFTITAGNANGEPPYMDGGGMKNVHSDPTITNVIFTNNSAASHGGGMHNIQSNPTLTNVTFSENAAPNGGGLGFSQGNLILTNGIFSGNSAAYGGGLYNSASDSTLTNVTISGNSAAYGGGLHNSGHNSTFTNVTISGNSAAYGGGLYSFSSDLIVTNVTISGNSATSRGGGLYNSSGSPTFTNMTISGNSAVTQGGGIYNLNSSPTIINTILWNNISPTGAQIYNLNDVPVFSYSIVQGGYAGTGNLDVDPLLGPLQNNGGFTQTMALSSGSPGIDTGDDANCPAADQRGLTRPQGAHCDIGAFEYGGILTTITAGNASVTYGSILVNLSATVSPNPGAGTVQFYMDDNPIGSPVEINASDGTATLSDNPGTLNAGGHTIRADFLGSGSFLSSSSKPDTNGTLTVNPLAIHVIADAKTKLVGTADPVLTYTSNPSLVNGDSFFGALTRVSGEAVGTYAITRGTLSAGDNYIISFTGANLTITAAPTVLSIHRAGVDPTSADSVNFTVTFSENVTGVNLSYPFNDFTLTTMGVSGAVITSVSGSGDTYTVAVNTGSGNGTIRLDVVDDNTIIDAASNPLGGVNEGDGDFMAGETYTIDKEFTSCVTQTEIPEAECDALVALYNSTNGAGWNNNTSWLQTDTPCSWFGVTCAADSVAELDLGGNNLVGTIPAALSSLTNITKLVLAGNHLGGLIPIQLGSLTNLTYLELSSNQLSGSIPPQLGNLTSLTRLNFFSNQLSGSIPPQLGNLTNLTTLSLVSNQLTGSIPIELGNLTNLIGLYISFNQLTGSIPSELDNLINLKYFHLNNNHLTGELPASITNLTNLLEIRFDCGITSSDPIVIAFIDNLVPGWQNNICPIVLSTTRDNPNPTSLSNVTFTVTFSEPVTGVNTSAPFSDFALATTGVTGVTITGVSGSGATYMVTVNTGSGNGTIRLDVVDDDSIRDGANHPLGGVGAENGDYTGGEVYQTAKGFHNASAWSPAYSYNAGWRVDQHPRLLADVNGDGKADAVGFGDAGVYVALANAEGTGFAPTASLWTGAFSYNAGWRVDQHPRMLADVNGDGKADAVGFGYAGVYVALANAAGTAFAPTASQWTGAFSYNAGWRVDQHPRLLADVNGDGKADAVGFGYAGVYVALANAEGTGFAPTASLWTGAFSYNAGWRVDQHPRMFADVNGDGKADAVGFGYAGVYVALANTDGTGFAPTASLWTGAFSYNAGWRVDQHPRLLADVNGDGKADAVGFGNAGVYVALANHTGTAFTPTSSLWTTSFSYAAGWRVDQHPRMLADVNGDGKADAVGFGYAGVYVAVSR